MAPVHFTAADLDFGLHLSKKPEAIFKPVLVCAYEVAGTGVDVGKDGLRKCKNDEPEQ